MGIPLRYAYFNSGAWIRTQKGVGEKRKVFPVEEIAPPKAERLEAEGF
jgi:hypothetical protein